MIVSFLSENLLQYLSLLNKVLPSHSQVPILSNVLLTATKQGFYIKATDLEMGCEIKIAAKVEREGSITVPGKEFLEIINSLPQDKTTLTYEKEQLVVECRGNKATFNTISAAEFPQLYKEKGEEVANFSKEDFLDIFSSLLFSVSQDESRPQLTGVYIDDKGEMVNFVSTDGYRMSIKRHDKKKAKIKEGLIVGAKLLQEATTLKGEGGVVLYTNKAENQIAVEAGDALLVGRMIEGAFPDYEKVLSSKSATKITFDREEMQQNLKIASVFARDNSNIVNLAVEGDKIILTTQSQGIGEGKAVVECTKEGEDNKIAFNIRYLSDVLKAVNDKVIELRINSPMEPALFEVKEKNFLHVIMPIQVDG